MDRISKLPDFTIHHIMSYLSAKEVAQTSVLSKKWFNLYVSFPIFDFHKLYKWFVGDLANKNPKTFCKNETIRFHKCLNRFTEFVDAFLVRFSNLKLCMQKFRLLIGLLDVEASSFLLDKWIGLAVRNGVKELDLNVQIDKNAVYTVPWIIFSATSMHALKLEGCKLEHITEIIRLYSLKSLILKKVAINEEIVQKLTSQCPLLEDLRVSSCVLIERIRISSYRLKRLSISSCFKLKKIEIYTPNLLFFYYRNHPILTSIVNAPCPWELHFKNAIDELGNKVDPDAQWFLNMKDFLGVSNQIRFIVMDVKSKRDSFNFEEFRNNLSSLPYEVERLWVRLDAPPSSFAALLDGLLGICYSRKFYVYIRQELHHNFVEWLCNEMVNRDDSCCNSRNIKCWRHYLKDFKIKGFLFLHSIDSPSLNRKPLDVNAVMDLWPKFQMESLNVVWIGVFLNLSREFDRVGSSDFARSSSSRQSPRSSSLALLHNVTV